MTLRAASPARLNPWLFFKQYPKVPIRQVVLLRGPAPQPGWGPLQCVLILSYSGPSISVRRRRSACAAAVLAGQVGSPPVPFCRQSGFVAPRRRTSPRTRRTRLPGRALIALSLSGDIGRCPHRRTTRPAVVLDLEVSDHGKL